MNPSNAAFGQGGFDQITGTTLTGEFYAIIPDGGSATYRAITKKGDNLRSRASAEGIVTVGDFTSITVTSGTVLAYRTFTQT